MSLTADTRRPARQELAEADVLGGRYELLDRVGRGGMSVVWRARDRVSDRLVAVKVLAEAYADDHELRQRLRQEAQVAAMVSSPYVAQASGCGEYQRGDRMAPFIVMEFVDGITLQDRLNAGPVLPAAAMRIGAQVASALAAIHEAAVVHCDIKPANVMLVGDAVKVVDFGIAARAGSEDTLSHPSRSWAHRRTWHPNDSPATPSWRPPTSTHWASCSTACSRDAPPGLSRAPRRCWPRTYRNSPHPCRRSPRSPPSSPRCATSASPRTPTRDRARTTQDFSSPAAQEPAPTRAVCLR